MPEGPEVAHTARQLRTRLTGATIQAVHLAPGAKVNGTIPTGVIITNIWSYGKKVGFALSSGQTLLGSLGMTGYFAFTPRPGTNAHSPVSWRVGLETSQGPLYFGDPRMLGDLTMVDDICYYLFQYKRLGPDLVRAAMTETLPWEQWAAIFGLTNGQVSTRLITDVLLDQSLVAGIGNYLKSEILYYAGVAPHRRANTLSETEWRHLWVQAHAVMRCAYEHGGLTIATHISPEGDRGVYPCAVYHKTRDPHGYPVLATGESRNSFWVPQMQR